MNTPWVLPHKTQAVIFDIGGVLLDGETPMAGALEAIAALREARLPFLLLTNTTRRSHANLLAALNRVGFLLRPEQLLTPARAAAVWLQAHQTPALFLIHEGLRADFDGCAALGAQATSEATQASAVVIGDAGDGFTYAALNAAFRAIHAGAHLLSLADSRFFREGGALWLDAGPFVRLLEDAASVRAVSLGKPGAAFFQQAIDVLGVPAAHIVMIGDDITTDILGAAAVGLKTMLVQTGKYQPADQAKLPPNSRCVPDVLAAVRDILAG